MHQQHASVTHFALFVFFLGTNVVTFLFFWLFGGFYLFMDLTGRPKWALQYKIQDGTNQPVSYKIQTLKQFWS